MAGEQNDCFYSRLDKEKCSFAEFILHACAVEHLIAAPAFLMIRLLEPGLILPALSILLFSHAAIAAIVAVSMLAIPASCGGSGFVKPARLLPTRPKRQTRTSGLHKANRAKLREIAARQTCLCQSTGGCSTHNANNIISTARDSSGDAATDVARLAIGEP